MDAHAACPGFEPGGVLWRCAFTAQRHIKLSLYLLHAFRPPPRRFPILTVPDQTANDALLVPVYQ